MFLSKIGAKIMGFYCQYPSKEEHVQSLAKLLGVGAGSVSTTCSSLNAKDFLIKRKRGNALFYALNKENLLVKRLKTTWFLEKLLSLEKEWNKNTLISVALFGSYASGEFTEKSDADILVITNMKSDSVYALFLPVGYKLGVDLMPVVYTVSKWMELAKMKDRFYIEILSNHVLLSGNPILVG